MGGYCENIKIVDALYYDCLKKFLFLFLNTMIFQLQGGEVQNVYSVTSMKTVTTFHLSF